MLRLKPTRVLKRYYSEGIPISFKIGTFSEVQEIVQAPPCSVAVHIVRMEVDSPSLLSSSVLLSALSDEQAIVSSTHLVVEGGSSERLQLALPEAGASFVVYVFPIAATPFSGHVSCVKAFVSDVLQVRPEGVDVDPFDLCFDSFRLLPSPSSSSSSSSPSSSSSSSPLLAVRERSGETIGSHIWDGAFALCDYWQFFSEHHPQPFPLLELGSGTGVFSLFVALERRARDASCEGELEGVVYCTDKPDAQLRKLQQDNIEFHSSSSSSSLPLELVDLDFTLTVEEHLASTPFFLQRRECYDSSSSALSSCLLVACDVLYDRAMLPPFLSTLRFLFDFLVKDADSTPALLPVPSILPVLVVQNDREASNNNKDPFDHPFFRLLDEQEAEACQVHATHLGDCGYDAEHTTVHFYLLLLSSDPLSPDVVEACSAVFKEPFNTFLLALGT